MNVEDALLATCCFFESSIKPVQKVKVVRVILKVLNPVSLPKLIKLIEMSVIDTYLFLFRCNYTTEAQGLQVLGGGKGSGHALTKKSKGT